MPDLTTALRKANSYPIITKKGTRLTNRAVQDMVKKYIKAAGLDPKRISTHKLRHTAATLMYRYGKVDIRSLQAILGHESLSTTEIYTHLDNNQLQSVFSFPPFIWYCASLL